MACGAWPLPPNSARTFLFDVSGLQFGARVGASLFVTFPSRRCGFFHKARLVLGPTSPARDQHATRQLGKRGTKGGRSGEERSRSERFDLKRIQLSSKLSP